MEQRWPIDITGIEPVRPLGSGGFGQVWLARQAALDRRVAVKIGHRPFANADDRRRFERECLALGRLSGHPHIIDVHTSGVIDGVPYLVLEYVDGGTLADGRNEWGEGDLRRLTVELSGAVSAAHAIGVLHRDLKPENVFLRANGASVLGDFGIARLGDGNVTSAPGVTASMAFAPPEILSGQPPSEQADVYGIGITIVSTVLGESPFISGGVSTLEGIVAAVLRGATPDLEGHGLSPGFSALLQQAIDLDPDRRPSSAQALAESVTALVPIPLNLATRAAPGAAPNPLPNPPANPLPNAVAGLGGAGIAGAAGAGGGATVTPDPPIVYRAPASPAESSRPPFPTADPAPRPSPGPGDGSSGISGQALALLTAGAVVVLGLGIGGAWLLAGDDDGERPVTTPTTTDAEAGFVSDADADADEDEDQDDSTIAIPEVSVPEVEGPEVDVPDGDEATETGALLPLAVPLVGSTISDLTRIPIDTAGLDELTGPADLPQFCDNRPDITGLVETTGAIYPTDASVPVDGVLVLVQVAQRMHRFSTAEQADAFVESYVGLVDCESWEDATLTSDNASSVLRATVVDDGEQYGDKTRRVDQVTTLPVGVDIHSRTVLVRDGVDVFKLFLTTDRAEELEPDTEALLAAAVEQLGY